MAYSNFKATVWSKHIQQQMPKLTVFEEGCDYRFKGEVGLGKTVKILGVARPTIGDYLGTSIGAPETVEDSAMSLVIDKAKYFNFMVDDVDEAQSTEGLMEALLEESTRAMAEERDKYIAALIKENAVNVSTAATITTAAQAKAAVDEAIQFLWNHGVSQKDDVTVYLNPRTYMLFQDYIIGVKSDNLTEVANGQVGTYCGAKVRMSNNFAHDDDGYEYMFVKTAKAVAFASGIDEVEAYRPEGLFSDAVKGLNTFGGKIVRPNELYVIKAN